METVDFEFRGKKYKMRQLSWDEDLSLQEQCTDPLTGTLRYKQFSLLRVARSLVEPKILIDDLKQLPAQEGNFLAAMAAQLNDLSPSELKKNQTPTTNST